MPLIPTDECIEQMGDVHFAMMDGERRIVCRVSGEALDVATAASGGGPKATDAVKCFLKFRERIEKIASKKYDAGDRNPVVTTQDLNG